MLLMMTSSLQLYIQTVRCFWEACQGILDNEPTSLVQLTKVQVVFVYHVPPWFRHGAEMVVKQRKWSKAAESSTSVHLFLLLICTTSQIDFFFPCSASAELKGSQIQLMSTSCYEIKGDGV